MTEFTPIASTAGGLLIGLSAVALMALIGRIAGMTGILAALIPPVADDWQWRAAFIGGAILAPIVYLVGFGEQAAFLVPVSQLAMVVGGLIVGVGVTFGSGCTSGHGVCGMARFSVRSIVATVTFMAATFVTVYVTRHLLLV